MTVGCENRKTLFVQGEAIDIEADVQVIDDGRRYIFLGLGIRVGVPLPVSGLSSPSTSTFQFS